MQSGEDIEGKLKFEDKAVEEDIHEVEQDFKEIEENIENMEKDVETAGIQGKTEEEIRKEAITTGAVVGGAVSLAGGTPSQAITAGMVTSAIKEEKERGKLNEWEGMVNDKPDEQAVENFRETQEKMIEQQQEYEKERIRK